jgi:hypothetical protein
VIENDDGEDSAIKLSSGYGDITLTVPRDYSLDLDLTIAYTRNSSRKFRIISELDGLDVEEERTQEWEEDYGSAKKYIYGSGTAHGGRHRVTMYTTNGNIRIRER